jgi:hypothetical protein
MRATAILGNKKFGLDGLARRTLDATQTYSIRSAVFLYSK